MTEPAAHPAPAGGAVRLLRLLFTVSTIAFVLLGAIIVVGQALTLLFGQGMPAFHLAESLGPYAFGASTLAGLFAFALLYFRAPTDAELHHE